jgi:hypothetical protein
MLVAWRDDGFWTLLLLRCWFHLRHGLIRKLPGPGFVGRESESFRGTGARHARLLSTRLRRSHSTFDARLWRLTCKWEAYQVYPEVPYGTGSVPGG